MAKAADVGHVCWRCGVDVGQVMCVGGVVWMEVGQVEYVNMDGGWSG